MGRLNFNVTSLEKRMGALPEQKGGSASGQVTPSELIEAGAAIPLRKTFEYQSYFDSTLLDMALRTQNPAEPIVASTLLSSTDGVTPDGDNQQISGYGIGLHPGSQTPIAIELKGLAASRSSVVILKPGQTYFPGGRSQFSGFRWGLPFGWLGGGAAYLMVFKTRETFKSWPGNPELIFHRMRMNAYLTTSNPAASALRANWPLRFPWPAATSGILNSNGSPQKGLPILGVVPTKVVVRARVALATADTIRLLFQKTDDLDLLHSSLSGGGWPDVPKYDAGNVSGTAIEFTFPKMSNSGFLIGGVAQAEFPEALLDDKVLRLGGDNAIVIPIDMTGSIGGAGGSPNLDIVRYGFIG